LDLPRILWLPGFGGASHKCAEVKLIVMINVRKTLPVSGMTSWEVEREERGRTERESGRAGRGAGQRAGGM
jgi:hypothetical protein